MNAPCSSYNQFLGDRLGKHERIKWTVVANLDDVLRGLLLPQVIELVGEKQMVFGTDMPHGDRERFAGRELVKRKDINDSAKAAMLDANPKRLYGLS
jgi:predicted TIM-barrel fold metal-dependent hydrolase